MKILSILLLIFSVSACASQTSQEVRCDGRLQPINLPMANTAAPAAPLRRVP